MLFSDFFDANRRFFDNYSSDSYPFEICIREETQNDVIKVHPKRSYKTTNRIVEKNKWIYVFDTEKGQKMVYGNTCKDRAELKKYIDQLRYGRAMNHIRVYKNDSYTIPAGTMYGFNKGMLYFQVENPSDNVYNIYDYDRENEILDTTDAINCADVPFISENIPQISKNKLSLPQFNIRIINTLFFKTCKFKNAR
jgi:mannose-6-phosphate isomerase class I